MEFVTVLILLEAAAAAFVAGRLLQFRLNGRFPAVFFYLVYMAGGEVVLSLSPRSSHTYFFTFLVLQAVGWVASVLAVRELFSIVFQDYPGIRTAGRRGVHIAAILSVLVLVAVMLLFPAHQHRSSSNLYYFSVMTRSVDLSLTVLIVVILLVLSRYPLRLPGNTYLSACMFGAVFLTEGLGQLADSISRYLHSNWADFAQLALPIILFSIWGLRLSSKKAEGSKRRPVASAREQELLRQLAAVNRMFSGAAQQ